jgi:acyl carrier protein
MKMNNQELIDKLKKIVKPYVQNEESYQSLNEETRFIEDLKINSANLVDVILDVEDEFDIEIGDDEMEQMLDVKSSIAIITQKINKQK